MDNKLWIVVPCYYDVRAFSKVIQDIKTQLQTFLYLNKLELFCVVVDDSAGFDTEISSLKQNKSIIIVTPPFNMGHQGAIVYGLRYLNQLVSTRDYIITMDSDGEDCAQDIPKLVVPLIENSENKHLVCLAERTHRKESPLFKLSYFFYKILFRTLTGVVIRSGNFVSYRGEFLREVIFHPNFDLCYSSTFKSIKLNLLSVPIARGERYFGKSKMGYFGLINHGARMMLPFLEIISLRVVIFLICFFSLSLILYSLIISEYFYFKPAIIWLFCIIFVNIIGVFITLFVVSYQFKLRQIARILERK